MCALMEDWGRGEGEGRAAHHVGHACLCWSREWKIQESSVECACV